VRVKTQLMAVHRRSARDRGKSDPIDAHAVAMAALREPNLPIARLDGPSREVKLLGDHRHDLVCERTKLISRLRWHLHELDPELQVPLRGFKRYCVMDELAERLITFTGMVAQIAAELLTRCRQMTRQINDLEDQIRDRARVLAPSLLEVPGCGVLSAAVVVGETAGTHRFHSKDAYARFNGTAPIPVWSAQERVRLSTAAGTAPSTPPYTQLRSRRPLTVGRARTTSTNFKPPGRLGAKLFDCSAGDFPIGCSVSCVPTNLPSKM